MDHLKELVGSEARARVLAHYVAHPGSTLHVRALERHIGIVSRSLQLELERLESMGLLRRREEGRRVVYERTGAKEWRALGAIVGSFAPLAILRDVLSNVPGVAGAFVFGSHAAGTAREDSDIDVLVFGDDIPDAAFGAALNTAYATIDKSLDVKRYDSERFIREVRSGASFLPVALRGPKQWLVGSPVVLPDAGGAAA